MPKLSWISDRSLNAAIGKLQTSSASAVTASEERQRRNVVDPFSSLVIASALDVTSEAELLAIQNGNSALRGMSNALGTFHQDVLGSVRNWRNHDAGYDLENSNHRVLAEVKNKHNTMNASTYEKTVADLDTAVRQKGRGWSGYLVMVIPRTPHRYQTQIGNRAVYEIDGASFYHEATGSSNALHDLFDVLSRELGTTDEVVRYCQRTMAASLPPRI